jgi:hypothetical protein
MTPILYPLRRKIDAQPELYTEKPTANTDLITGTQELISELQERLEAGEYFDNRKLTEIADKEFGGIRARTLHITRRLRRFRACSQQALGNECKRVNASGL